MLAAVELLVGCPLMFGAWILWREVVHDPHVRFDDLLGLSAMAVGGVGVTMAGATTVFHRGLSYRFLRRARILAAARELCMIAAGAGIWGIAHRRGGDWAGLGVLGGMLFIAVGTLLLLLCLFGLRYIRRFRPEDLPL